MDTWDPPKDYFRQHWTYLAFCGILDHHPPPPGSDPGKGHVISHASYRGLALQIQWLSVARRVREDISGTQP